MQALIDTLPLFTWQMDRDWRITKVSDAISWVMGLNPADLIGVQVMDVNFGTAETEGGLAHYFDTLLSEKSFSNLCYERIALNGTRCVLMDSAIPILDGAGRFAGYEGITFELSRTIQQAEETASLVYSLKSRADQLEKELSVRNKELESTNHLLTEIIEAMGEGLLVTSDQTTDDGQDRIEFTNQAFLDQFDLTPDQIRCGMPQSDLLSIMAARGDMDSVADEMAQIIRQLRGKGTAMIRLKRSGRSLYCRASTRPSGGRVMVHTDVTELEARSAALGRALEQAGAASAAKSNFLATMSHEFRTPLNGIVGLTDVLAETPLNAEQKELVSTIQSSAAALTGLINDILDFSKIEAGHGALASEPVFLADLARDVLALVRPLAQAKALKLDLSIGADVPETVCGDPLRLRQVLLNLLGNAVKFTDLGTVTLEISGPGPIVLTVRDTGIGIPEPELATLYEPFRQVQSGLQRQFEGTGLGLAITQRLIEMMGGAMHVTSQVGVGSCFRLTLPLKCCAKGIKTVDMAHAPPVGLAGLRVLVAEDNRTNQMVLRKMLEKAGAQVTIAASGTEAFEAAKCVNVDVILMDVAMPGMNGFEASRAIRAFEDKVGLPRRPIIAVTGNASDKDRAMAMEAGMDDFLAKPVRRDQMLACVANFLVAET
ncbi:ATP-binding protein [Oceaniglobus ichthyenteri]|uniref:ATP-binding protein n=1 Tax=Oceaniglobus ichthyenteri TaxID=2136177 RepID=UPI0013DDC76F|nr:ATP-binding protein [Oceaniglobus ichthyenteri]